MKDFSLYDSVLAFMNDKCYKGIVINIEEIENYSKVSKKYEVWFCERIYLKDFLFNYAHKQISYQRLTYMNADDAINSWWFDRKDLKLDQKKIRSERIKKLLENNNDL
jgi:hypothetical protein